MPFVRCVGQPDPMEVDPDRVRQLIADKKLTKEDVWTFNAKRRVVMEGVTYRVLGPREGMSKTYQWGPDKGTFVILVTDQDWTRIQELAEAKDFVLAIDHKE